MTGRINLTPEAERQLNEIDDWIANTATADIARHFVSAILEHIDGIPTFPFAGRARDDVRPGMRTTTFRKRTLVGYEVDESSGEVVINVLGIFHGGQYWEVTLKQGQGVPDADR
jgi:plasmid stabilization system protein ParE